MCPPELKDIYVFSALFNKDKVFFYDQPKEIDINSLPQLEENWLIELEGLLQQENSLGRHITAYPSLKDHLKMIYHRLNNNLDDLLGPLSDSDRQEIIEKLKEEIDQCSEGFFNRVNQIIHSFQRPQNLSQLLCQARQGIVNERVAIHLTDEIHSWNLVTKIAMRQGLGVEANHEGDKFQGDEQTDLTEEEIEIALKQEFEIFFTPNHIPHLLATYLHPILVRVGYDGLKDGNGYLLGDVETITATLKAFLSKSYQEIPGYKFFIIDEESSALRDLNWPEIKKYLLASLVEDHYFVEQPTPQTILNLFDYVCYIDLYPEHADLEINPEFFNKSTLYFELQKIKTALPFFWKKLHANSRFINLFQLFIDQLVESRTVSENDLETLKTLLSLNFNILTENKEQFLHFVVSFKDHSNWNMLMLAIRYFPEALESFPALIEMSTLQEMFLQKTDEGKNILMLAASYPKGLAYLSNLLGTYPELIGKADLQQMILDKKKGFFDMLTEASYMCPDKLPALLNFLSKHHQFISQATLKELFLQKAPNGRSLMLMMFLGSKREKEIKLILNFLLKHHQFLGQATIKQILLKETDANENLLMKLADRKPQALIMLLKFLSKHPQLIEPATLKEMLLEKTGKGSNILMELTCSNLFELSTLNKFISALINFSFIEKSILQQMFFETTHDGMNLLSMVACYHNPKQLGSLLKFLLFLSRTPIFESSETNLIQWMLSKKTDTGENALMLVAYHHSPEELKPFINFLAKNHQFIGQDTLNSIFSQKSDEPCLDLFSLSSCFTAEELDKLFVILPKDKESGLICPKILKKIFLEEKKVFWTQFFLDQSLDCPETAKKLVKFLLAHYGSFDKETIQSIVSKQLDKSLNLLIASELISSLQKEIEIREKNLSSSHSFFKKPFDDHLKAVCALKDYLQGLSLGSRVDHLQSLIKLHPTLSTDDQLCEIVKLIQKIESPANEKVYSKLTNS